MIGDWGWVVANDPSRSATNTDHRARDVPNLFIANGSNFVTSGRNQPTYTIQALAYHAAGRIIRLGRRGELRT